MKPINYNGVELAGSTENLIYARDGQTQKIVLLNCSHNEYVNEKVPLCSKIENVEKCLTKLLHREFSEAISNCEFTFLEPQISERLHDESILISKSSAQISENGRLIFKPPPMIIYSNYEVIVSINEDEILYPPTIKFESQAIYTTKLTPSEISAMWNKAAWDVYVKGFHWSDWLEYAALGLQGIFIPLALCGCCLSCRNRGYSKLDRQMEKKQDADLKRRFEENRTLLNLPASRIIAVPQQPKRKTVPVPAPLHSRSYV
jgi:hypothetical protein